jgi:hypothetical protein
MPRVSIRSNNVNSFKKLKEIIEHTKILKRQRELIYGRWDFVVFGPKGRNNTIIREGNAEHVRILNSSIYIASIGYPNHVEVHGIPIEEFMSGDLPEELKGVEIYQVDPLRPLTISMKKEGPLLQNAINLVQKEYEDKNIAIIQTPEEEYWGISVLKYLNECDRYFPDALTEAIRKGNLPIDARFIDLTGFIERIN